MRILRNRKVSIGSGVNYAATLITCLPAVNLSGAFASVKKQLKGYRRWNPSGVPKIDAQASLLLLAFCPASYSSSWLRLNCASTGQNSMRDSYISIPLVWKKKAKGESFGGRKRLALSEGQKETINKIEE